MFPEPQTSLTCRERWLIALAVLVLGVALRLPFLAESLSVPVDGDTGIIGLMALDHVVSGTMWGQPYGSPVESWLVMPFVELLGPTRLALRLAYFFISLGLVPLAFGLARALHPAAGLPAALVLACPPAFLLAWSAVPQPLYPATLVLVTSCLLAALTTESRLAHGGSYRIPLGLWSVCGALAVWTHIVSLFAVAPSAMLLAWRARGVPRRLAAVLAALVVPLVPALVLLSPGSGAEGVVATSLHHARIVMPRMHLALTELLGGRASAVADVDRAIVSPAWARIALGLGYVVGAVGALRSRRRAAALMLWAVVALATLAFPFPVRSYGAAVRFLAPAYVPLAALTVVGAACWSARAAWAVAALVAVLHLLPVPALVDSWRRGAHANPFSPDCTAARTAMEVLGVRRGYASYNTAYCITYESGQRIVVSQPWNERFSAWPLPYLDEVRFATAVAWIFRGPEDDFGMPPPERFESLLRSAGGTWRRWDREGFVIYHSFVAPFPDTVEEAGTRRCNGALTLPLPRPGTVGGVTVLARPGGVLPERLTVETSVDGRHFETAWSRRRPRALTKLVWLNGNPRYSIDPAAVAVLVPGGRPLAQVRLTTPGADACAAIGTVLFHRGSPGPAPPDWIGLDTSWPERRRILSLEPLPDRASWHYRKLVAEAHR